MLLQTGFRTQLLDTADSTTMIIAGIVIGGLLLALIIAGIITNRRATSRKTGKRGRYSKGSFRRRAARLGLTKTHIKALEFITERYKVRNPYALLDNTPQLDLYLRKAIRGIEGQSSPDSIKENQKSTLYRVKQIIERNTEKTVSYSSTRQLNTNQRITISTNNGVLYESKIVSVLRDAVAIATPVDDADRQVRWKKWSPVKVYLWKANGEGFSLISKIIGYDTIKGVSSAYLQHTNKIQKSKQRQYRRKTLDRPCYFYPVRILTTGSGKRQIKKAFVETKRGALGTVIEISAGGCSVRASRSLESGALVKLDFDTYHGTPISLYGKVVNSRREDIMGHIMHIMFTRVSRKNLNSINEFVYDYVQVG